MSLPSCFSLALHRWIHFSVTTHPLGHLSSATAMWYQVLSIRALSMVAPIVLARRLQRKGRKERMVLPSRAVSTQRIVMAPLCAPLSRQVHADLQLDLLFFALRTGPRGISAPCALTLRMANTNAIGRALPRSIALSKHREKARARAPLKVKAIRVRTARASGRKPGQRSVHKLGLLLPSALCRHNLPVRLYPYQFSPSPLPRLAFTLQILVSTQVTSATMAPPMILCR